MAIVHCTKGSFPRNSVNLVLDWGILQGVRCAILNSSFSLLFIRLCFEMLVENHLFTGNFEGFFVVGRLVTRLFFYFRVDMKVFLLGTISFRTSTKLSFMVDDGFVHLGVNSPSCLFVRLRSWNSISLFIRHHFIKIMRKC